MVKDFHFLFSSESVTEGHPDKVADQISDAVLDACLQADPESRVACETLISQNTVVVAGEITSSFPVKKHLESLVEKTLDTIGYTNDEHGFNRSSYRIEDLLTTQSPDIAMGVDTGGAGDQGLMFGYACNETPEKMPIAISSAHAITKKLAEMRKTGSIPWLRPDGKAQVTYAYDIFGMPKFLESVLVSTQHDPEVSLNEVRETIIEQILEPLKLIPQKSKEKILINPTGRFVVGGPQGDSGLTGRKIIVDTYGGSARHGGGAFSGKDPSKVDRSAAYMARHLAKRFLIDECNISAHSVEVQIAYAIGVANPVSVSFFLKTTDGHVYFLNDVKDRFLSKFDLTPRGIIKHLGLKSHKYLPTASYGHFGNSDYSWEK